MAEEKSEYSVRIAALSLICKGNPACDPYAPKRCLYFRLRKNKGSFDYYCSNRTGKAGPKIKD